MRYVAIMAGGSGTRLWPLSRKGTPKQLLPLIDGVSLLRLALERAQQVVPVERVFIVTGAAYVADAISVLPEVPVENFLAEPVGRDSLNAATWPAAVLAARDPDAVVAQLTADQVIEPTQTFVSALLTAFELAETDADTLITFGVVPTHPHPGYGYLRFGDPIPGFPGAYQVCDFTEKPAPKLAATYLESGDYWWNAGMFVWRAATFLDQVRQLCPAAYAGALSLVAQPDRLADIFPTLPKISIDYAVMEPVAQGRTNARVAIVALPVTWKDIGGYAALAELLAKDEGDNAVQGPVVSVDAHHNIVINTDPDTVVGVLGVEGLVVVRTSEATLVVPVDQTERVKALVEAVVQSQGPAYG